MRQSHSDLVWVAVLALAGLLVNIIGNVMWGLADSPLRVALGIALALFLPGYAMSQALFPARRLALSETVLLSVGLSFAISILGGLILNLTPLGMNTNSWAILLGGTTLVACLAASYARGQLSEDWIAYENAGKPAPALRLLARQWPVLLSALALTVAAVVFARSEANNDPVPIVQLWMLRDTTAKTPTIRIGINNANSQSTGYKLRLQLKSGKVLQDWPTITVPPATGWETHLELGKQAPTDEPLEALLYRLDTPDDVLRRTTIWVK